MTGFLQQIPVRYLRQILTDILLLLLLVLLVVEALYLSDKVITHLLFDALRNQLGIAFLAKTIVLAVPEILSVGFSLALLVATYLVLARRRETGEFVILAGAGTGPAALLSLSIVLGLIGASVYIGMRGYLQPIAAQQLDITLAEGRYQAARNGQLTVGKFLDLENAVLYRFEIGDENNQETRVFTHAEPTPGIEQIVIAEAALLDFEPSSGVGKLTFQDPSIHEFSWLYDVGRAEQTRVTVGSFTLSPIGLGNAPLAHRVEYLSLADHLWLLRQGADKSAVHVLTIVMGAAVAFLAPLLALVAVAVGKGKGAILSLPISVLALLCAQLLNSWASAALANLGGVGFLIMFAGLSAMTFSLVALVFAKLRSALLPQGVIL